ncbi:MAG: lipopolysaccharide assembly protein LapA domain-containing protein [Acidimicrobiales bacterium]
MADDDGGLAREQGRRLGARAIGLAVAVLALVAFIVQNTGDIRVEWLVFDVTLPLWLLLLITAVLGAVVANLGGWLARRRRD